MKVLHSTADNRLAIHNLPLPELACAMGDTEDGRQGLPEDQLIDDAMMDTLIRESVSQTVGDNAFSQARVHQWTSSMTDGCLKRLAALNKPFKYVCHFTLGQRVRKLRRAYLPVSCSESLPAAVDMSTLRPLTGWRRPASGEHRSVERQDGRQDVCQVGVADRDGAGHRVLACCLGLLPV